MCGNAIQNLQRGKKRKLSVAIIYGTLFFTLLATVLPQTDPVCWVSFLSAHLGHCPAPYPLIPPVFPLLGLFHWLLFSHFKEAPDSLLSCFPIHPESHHS